MSAFTRNPANPNYLHPNKFQLNFSRVPNLQYFCQYITIQGIYLSEIVSNTPLVDLYSPGEKAVYDTLNITFLVDEELKSWLEIHDWIRAMTKVTSFEEYDKLKLLNPNANSRGDLMPQFSDGQITLLSSANNPLHTFKFYDMFPTSVSTFVVSASDTPDSIITADATFRYSYFDVDRAT